MFLIYLILLLIYGSEFTPTRIVKAILTAGLIVILSNIIDNTLIDLLKNNTLIYNITSITLQKKLLLRPS